MFPPLWTMGRSLTQVLCSVPRLVGGLRENRKRISVEKATPRSPSGIGTFEAAYRTTASAFSSRISWPLDLFSVQVRRPSASTATRTTAALLARGGRIWTFEALHVRRQAAAELRY